MRNLFAKSKKRKISEINCKRYEAYELNALFNWQKIKRSSSRTSLNCYFFSKHYIFKIIKQWSNLKVKKYMYDRRWMIELSIAVSNWQGDLLTKGNI